jgi:hypothetical protein
MYTYVKEFHRAEIEGKIEAIILSLSEIDCENIEFLRGKLAAYNDLIETRPGWVKKELTFD